MLVWADLGQVIATTVGTTVSTKLERTQKQTNYLQILLTSLTVKTLMVSISIMSTVMTLLIPSLDVVANALPPTLMPRLKHFWTNLPPSYAPSLMLFKSRMGTTEVVMNSPMLPWILI